ncbi:hypothetical protein EDC94DRAFT_592007 [Helicostylum pulchrum]|nr:hypothetical protein EDC94DRAFT_592007 [Helicostylum pulchrum]
MQVPIFHQLFYYFGPMIDDKQQIALPTKEHKEWHSIDLGDLVSAVFNLSSSDSSEKNQTLFRFTGRHTITAEQMVKYASKGLEREDMTYNKIDPEEMYNYLSRIHGDNRFRERPNHSLFEGEDRSYLFPLGEYLNETCIHTLIEYWQLINTTEDTGRTSEDLDNALDGRESISLKQFFKDNKGQFQRLR